MFHGLRQQAEKDNAKEPYLCLSDFIAPKVHPHCDPDLDPDLNPTGCTTMLDGGAPSVYDVMRCMLSPCLVPACLLLAPEPPSWQALVRFFRVTCTWNRKSKDVPRVERLRAAAYVGEACTNDKCLYSTLFVVCWRLLDTQAPLSHLHWL